MSHQTISFIKSAIRIAGYIALGVFGGTEEFILWFGPLMVIASVLLVLSELVGIVEEFGH